MSNNADIRRMDFQTKSGKKPSFKLSNGDTVKF